MTDPQFVPTPLPAPTTPTDTDTAPAPGGDPAIHPHGATTLQGAKVATSVVFFLNGWTFATWAGRIPSVRDGLGLTPGQLGLLLLVGSMGALVGLPLAGRLAARFGSAGTVRLGAVICLTALIAAGTSVSVLHSVPAAGASLFGLTLGIGLWDVSMNLEGATVEHGLGRSIMPRYHAAFSAGSVVSALVAAALAARQVPLIVHFLVTAPIILALVLWQIRRFLPVRAAQHASQHDGRPAPAADRPGDAPAAGPATASSGVRSAWTEPRTLLIGLVTMVAAFAEGTANDWVSVAFIDGHHLPESAGVLGFATFLSFMTLGRMFGTNLMDRYPRVRVLAVLFFAAWVGSMMMVFGTPSVAFVGAAVWGFGVSLGFPAGMSAAADDPARAAARMSVVTTIAYSAFLVGPPLLGLLGDHFGVLRALSVVGVAILLAMFALPAMADQRTGTALDDPRVSDTHP